MAVIIKDRICRQCGKTFPGGPRAWYCPVCSSIRKKQRAAIRRQNPIPNRPLGSKDYCLVCGREYIVMSGLQKYCKDCAKGAIAEKDRDAGIAYYYANKDRINQVRYEKRKVKEKICIVCGKSFDPKGLPAEMCSEECRKIRRRLQQYDAERKRAKSKVNYEIKEFPHKFEYVTVAEYALAAGITPSGVSKRIEAGKISGVIKVGRNCYIPMSALEGLNIPDGGDYVTVREFSQMTGLSQKEIRKRIKEGKITGCVKPSTFILIPANESKMIQKDLTVNIPADKVNDE